MNYLIFFAIGVIGVAFHCVAKFISLQKDAKAANVDLSIKCYLTKDAASITLSFLSVLIWLFLFGEVAQKYPQIESFTRTSFAVMGVMGSWVIQLFMSKTKGYIKKIVDEKTNIADNKTEQV